MANTIRSKKGKPICGVKIYVFASKSLTNIWAGIGSRRWAIAASQAQMPGTATKASKVRIGALGLLYCSATKRDNALRHNLTSRSESNCEKRLAGGVALPIRHHRPGVPKSQHLKGCSRIRSSISAHDRQEMEPDFECAAAVCLSDVRSFRGRLGVFVLRAPTRLTRR